MSICLLTKVQITIPGLDAYKVSGGSVSRQQRLQQAVRELPSDWLLTPVYRKKPYRPGWQTEQIGRVQLSRLFDSGDRLQGENGPYTVWPDGLALLVPDGHVAVDIDGKAARWLATGLAAGEVNSRSVCWKSGKVGRLTVLYRLPDELAIRLSQLERTIGQVTLNQGIKHYGQAVELKLTGKSVTIPPSAHPETDGYRWVLSPEEVEIAIAPQWVCRAIKAEVERREQIKPAEAEQVKSWESLDAGSLEALIRQSLERISPDCHHEERIKVALALKSAGEQYFELYEEWASRAADYRAGKADREWEGLTPRAGGVTLGTLFWIAGVKFGGGGFGGGSGSSGKKERRAWSIQNRLDTFKANFWESLKQDFLLGKADIEYPGWCPDIDLSRSRTHLVQGWLGAGKTEAQIRLVERICREQPNKTIVWVANRVGLLENTLTRLKQRGLDAWIYQSDVSGNRALLEAGNGGVVLMCVESFKDYAVGRVDWANVVLLIDEFRALRTTALGRSEEFLQIEQALAEAGHLVVADAFLSDADRGVLKKYRGRDRLVYRQTAAKSPKKIKWLEVLTKDSLTSLTHDGGYFAVIDQLCDRTGRKALAVDNLLLANTIAGYLRGKGQIVLVSSSQTVSSNRDLLSNPTAEIEARNPDWFIYTPTIQAGADIQADFTCGLLISTGVLSPIDILQMLGRCRKCPEWFVSAPRFTEDERPVRGFSAKQVNYWAGKAEAAFEDLGIRPNSHTAAWGQWQEATREIERAYNSEYLYCLLGHFFESVETVEADGGRTTEFRTAVRRVRRDQVARQLDAAADLALGQELLAQKKAPKTDREYWACSLADWRSMFPEVVDLLIGLHGGEAETGELKLTVRTDYLDLGVLFQSRRLDGLKAYRRAQQDGIELKLERRIKGQRFVSVQSRTWKQYRAICLFRRLELEGLARATSNEKLAKDETGFWAGSPIVAELWERFQADQKLIGLFPEVETIEEFWRVCCRTMRTFGFQSQSCKARIVTQERTANGFKADGSIKWAYSKVVHLSGWVAHEVSGSELFQLNYEILIQAIDAAIERQDEAEDDYIYRQQQKQQEAQTWTAA